MSLQLSGYLSSSVDRNRKRNSRRSLTRATWQYVLPNCSEAKRYNTYGFSYWLFSSWTVSDARLPTLSLNTSKVGQIVAQAVSALWLRCIVEALFLEENYFDFIVCKFTPDSCSVAVVSSVVVMSSHVVTNRMRFYFFQSKCVVNVSSACHFPSRGGMQCKIVRLSLSFPRSKFENFMGYSCFMGLSLMPFGTLRIVERLIFLLRF